MTVNELVSSEDYYFHHSASGLGYISRKSEGEIEPYSGRYGEGYILRTPRFDTNRYHYISYYIRRDKHE